MVELASKKNITNESLFLLRYWDTCSSVILLFPSKILLDYNVPVLPAGLYLCQERKLEKYNLQLILRNLVKKWTNLNLAKVSHCLWFFNQREGWVLLPMHKSYLLIISTLPAWAFRWSWLDVHVFRERHCNIPCLLFLSVEETDSFAKTW